MDDDEDPPELNERNGAAIWGWVAGIAVLILIAFVLIGGWTSNRPTHPAPAHAGAFSYGSEQCG